MSQLLYRGILSSTHSWAVVGGELSKALYNLGYDIEVQSTNGTKAMDQLLKGIICKTPDPAPIGISYSIPRNIRAVNGRKKAIIYNYETTRMPPGMVRDLNQYADLILPSSNFAKDIFVQNGVRRDKIEVLPHGVDINKFNPDIPPMDLGNNKFKFLCVAEPHARKGFELLLRAFAEEFASTEDVMLVLKTSVKTGRRMHYEIDIKDLLKRFRRGYAMAEVRLITDKYPSLGPLYTACDAFVLPSRSECFGLPVLEAMACSLPVITTGWGGQTDFATKSNSYLISYKIVNAPKPMQYWHFDPRGKISAPDVQHLRTLMRHVYKNFEEAKQRAELAYQQAIPHYTWENVGEHLIELMKRRKWREVASVHRIRRTEQDKKQIEERAVETDKVHEAGLRKALATKREKMVQLQKEIALRQVELDKLTEQASGSVEDAKYKRLNNKFSGRISIIVLSYNTYSSTKRCIESIKANTTIDYNLVVVDNGSSDQSVEYLKSLKGVKVVLNDKNIGVSKGWNKGIKGVDKSSDIVVLNSDVLVPKGWLRTLSETAYDDPSIGVVGCRIKGLGSQKNHLLHTGAIIQRNGMGQENDWGIPLVDYGQCQLNRKVQIVVGACMYLKREVLDIVGLFDEQYTPAYFEDSDMCLKIAQAGYKVYYCGQVTLLHEHGATGKANKINVSALLETNRHKFMTKWRGFLKKRDAEIEIRGPIYGASGYAEACRNLVRGFKEVDVDVAYKPITSHPSEQQRKANFLNVIGQEAIDNPVSYDTCMVFYLADFFLHNFKGKKRRIGYTMLEVDGVPGHWVQYCNNYLTELWVPSTFNQQTFKRSGVRVPIRVVPLGVDTERFNPYIKPLIPHNDKFRFLCVCEMGERKNVHLLMRAFQSEFNKNEKVELILKITNNDPTINVEREMAKYDLRNVMLLTQYYNVHQMPSLFTSADCFVLPSSGEGWGLPYAEAMACGLPTIGTAWSANMDFMNSNNSYLIDVERIIPARARCSLYTGFNWALPDLKHLRRLMRRVYEGQKEAKEVGQRASLDIINNYSLARAAEIAKSHLI